jgi:hypothetical protein
MNIQIAVTFCCRKSLLISKIYPTDIEENSDRLVSTSQGIMGKGDCHIRRPCIISGQIDKQSSWFSSIFRSLS